MNCYRLTNVPNTIPTSALLDGSDYEVVARHIYSKTLYIRGPTIEPRLSCGSIYIDEFDYRPPEDEDKRNESCVVCIAIIVDDNSVKREVTDRGMIHIVRLFLDELDQRCALPTGIKVFYTYDWHCSTLFIQLPSTNHARAATNPNCPLFDARLAIINGQMVYMHSHQQSLRKSLYGDRCRKYKIPDRTRLPGLPKLLDVLDLGTLM